MVVSTKIIILLCYTIIIQQLYITGSRLHDKRCQVCQPIHGDNITGSPTCSMPEPPHHPYHYYHPNYHLFLHHHHRHHNDHSHLNHHWSSSHSMLLLYCSYWRIFIVPWESPRASFNVLRWKSPQSGFWWCSLRGCSPILHIAYCTFYIANCILQMLEASSFHCIEVELDKSTVIFFHLPAIQTVLVYFSNILLPSALFLVVECGRPGSSLPRLSSPIC